MCHEDQCAAWQCESSIIGKPWFSSFLTIEKAIQYLNKKGVAGNFAELQKSPQKITIKEAPAGSNDDHYNPNSKEITWDPLSAMTCTNGKKQTPALGLGHEAEHALGDIKGNAASAAPDGSVYDNLEEKRVIDGWEKNAAAKLGEGSRTDHRGNTYQVACPTCK